MISTLSTQNLILSVPKLEDLAAITDFETRNKDHLKQWESTSPLSLEPIKRLETWIKECRDGISARFLIRPKDSPSKVIGFCNFTQIFHGSFQACYLGYKIDHEYQGKGLMFEALETSIRYAFETLSLHRIMANYMPTNNRSSKLLQRLGFTLEGYAKNYLLINGRWEDHILTALSLEQWTLAQKKEKNTLQKTAAENVTFREVQSTDAPLLSPLMEQLGYPIKVATMEKSIQECSKLSNQRAWIAEKSGLAVGCIAVAKTQYFHRLGSFLRVIVMIVDEKQRRSGIGKSLMALAENFARDQGCSHIEVSSGMHRASLGSHEFYRSLGYTELNNTKKYFAKKL